MSYVDCNLLDTIFKHMFVWTSLRIRGNSDTETVRRKQMPGIQGYPRRPLFPAETVSARDTLGIPGRPHLKSYSGNSEAETLILDHHCFHGPVEGLFGDAFSEL